MFQALTRFGLWALLLVLAVYVTGEFFPNLGIGEVANADFARQAGFFALSVVALGLIGMIIQKLLGPSGSRCQVCGSSIPKGAIYCRAHLREIMAHEDEMSRRLPSR